MLKRNLTSELVSKFNDALAKIQQYKRERNYEEALTAIDNTLKELFRLGVKFFNSFSDENLIDMVKTYGTLNADKCIMMAKLLEEEAEIFQIQDKLNDSFYINLKSLSLFFEAYVNKDEDCDLQNFFSDIDIVIENICDYKLPLTLQIKIINYYASINQYDKAEDFLYEALKDSNFDGDVLEKGISFYETLLDKNDESLEEGNLSREEVIDSLNKLKKRL